MGGAELSQGRTPGSLPLPRHRHHSVAGTNDQGHAGSEQRLTAPEAGVPMGPTSGVREPTSGVGGPRSPLCGESPAPGLWPQPARLCPPSPPIPWAKPPSASSSKGARDPYKVT